MGDVIYRKWKPEDISQMIELRKQQLQEEGAKATVDITESLRDYYSRHVNGDTFISWLAVDGDTIVATSGLSITDKPPYYSNLTGRIGILSNMYTVKSYRRTGIAKKLIGFVMNEAKEHGCGMVEVVSSDMGVFLYQDFGFEKHHNYFQYNISNEPSTE